MDIKEKYYSLIKEKSLPNVLGEILEVSYSKKISILEELLSRFDESVIKIALGIYKQNHVDINKINITRLKNELVGCSLFVIKNLSKEVK